MLLLPGEILLKRYRITALLGAGPFGAVYRGWDAIDRVEVAIKEFRSGEPDAARLFRQEARRLSDLQHPQLPAVRDFFSRESDHYLISDFVRGVSLQELLDQYGPLPVDLLVDWLEAAAVPLAFLHEKKRLHLNLKPANIRVTPEGKVFVVDSGLPGLGIPGGASGFISLEQEKQQAVEPRSDIYALGATLYTLLTGRVPPAAVKREIGLEVTTPAREINPDVPPYLSILAGKAMALVPDQRPPTIEAFALGLRRPNSRGLEGEGNNAARDTLAPQEPRRSVGVDHRPTPPPHRRPASRRKQIQTRTIWGLSLVLVMLVLTIFALTRLNQEDLVGGSEAAATATIESQVISVLTAVAPTATPTPPPTLRPTPSPAPIVSKTGMRMLYVPGGVFRFGNDDGNPDEKPSQLVNMDPFYIDETEVTNAQYTQCVEDAGCTPPGQRGASYHPTYYGSAEYDSYPVIFVSWHQADNFCRWRGARLPTEAEWERAAGFNPATIQRTLFPWGDEFDGERLNYCDSRCPREGRDETTNDGHQDTAPVGSYPEGRSWIGAADMLGNVMEWVGDWYKRDYYAEAPNLNPRGPASGEFKVLRGGSWFSRVDELTVTTRGFFDPTVSRATLGFRCAMDLR